MTNCRGNITCIGKSFVVFYDQKRETVVETSKTDSPHPERIKTDKSLKSERGKVDVLLEDATSKTEHTFDGAETDALGEKTHLQQIASEAAPMEESVLRELNSKRKTTDASLLNERKKSDKILIERSKLLSDEQVARLKDEFLANLSHELRASVSVILGHAEMLESEALNLSPDDLSASIHTIARNAREQVRIIDDLLDESSVVLGKVSYKPIIFSPTDIFDETLESLRPTAEAKGITTVLNKSTAPASVFGDPKRLRQIIWNLLSNAIKFADRGGQANITVTAGAGNWYFSVADTGRGIAPEFLPYVFDPFRQEDASSTKRYHGLGLGLSIVRYFVELHGGVIKAESDGIGKGAKFTVTLPQSQEQQEVAYAKQKTTKKQVPLKAQAVLPLAKTKILLVDDSIDVRVLIRRMLARSGATIVDAESAADAREKLQSFSPDIIISDIGMPYENGLEFIRKLRLLGAENVKKIPAIALTAYVREVEKQAAISAGFQIHLRKPVTVSALLNAILQLIES